jgi:hypothetical protein
MQEMINDETKKLVRLAVFLRVYGFLCVIIFGLLIIGFLVKTPLLEEGGPLNWLIWNGIRCGGEPCHVPPMLFTIYLVWGVFCFLAARRPLAYVSFLNFTVGQLSPRPAHGPAGRHDDGSLLEQVVHRHPVRPDSCARDLRLATHFERPYGKCLTTL